jgi:hypothetical protein
MDQRWARPWFAATAACVVAGIVIQMFVNGHNASFFGGSTVGRILNIFAFFTIDSNVLIGVACALLAIRLDRTSTPFAVLRLTGLISITVTFVVFHVVLSRLQHTVVPILSIVGWLAFGPRGLTSGPMIKLTVIFPLAYMLFTAIRGPLASNWYPYPFVNVHDLGYVRVLINAVWIALLFIGFAAAATALDRRLAGPPATGHPAP